MTCYQSQHRIELHRRRESHRNVGAYRSYVVILNRRFFVINRTFITDDIRERDILPPSFLFQVGPRVDCVFYIIRPINAYNESNTNKAYEAEHTVA